MYYFINKEIYDFNNVDQTSYYEVYFKLLSLIKHLFLTFLKNSTVKILCLKSSPNNISFCNNQTRNTFTNIFSI